MRKSRRRTLKPSKALVPIAASGQEIALPAELEDTARDFARRSRAPRTLHEYGKHWVYFSRWCEAKGRRALPVSIATLAGYITELATVPSRRGRPLAISSIQIKMAAIAYYHGLQGHPLDMQHPDLKVVWEGIRRTQAATREIAKAPPLEFKELREVLETRRPDVVRDVLDSAILALGCLTALRRSELAGLDYQQPGETEDKRRRGYLRLDEDGLEVVLMTSKASQATAESVPVKREYAPTLCRVIEEWVALAKVGPGEPLFRSPGGRVHGWSESPQSPYPGVSWDKTAGKWRAQIWESGKSRRLGSWKEPYEAHLAWAKAKQISPSAKGSFALEPRRLNGACVTEAVRRRLRVYYKAQRRKKGQEPLTAEQLEAKVRAFTAHSLRAGCVTSLARAKVPIWQIMAISRHRNMETVNGYIRVVEKREDSGLKGVAF